MRWPTMRTIGSVLPPGGYGMNGRRSQQPLRLLALLYIRANGFLR
jgi:hypothetical protein